MELVAEENCSRGRESTGTLAYSSDRLGLDDLLVIGGDNLFMLNIAGLVRAFQDRTVGVLYDLDDSRASRLW